MSRKIFPYIRLFLLICAFSLTGIMTLFAKDSAPPLSANSPEAKAFHGSKVVKLRGCVACHAVGGVGGAVGPNLDRVGNRRDANWLREWLKDPRAVKPGTVMPNLHLSDKELDELVGILSHLKKEVNSATILNSAKSRVEKGEKLFTDYDCFACHQIGRSGMPIGPNLTWLGKRKPETWESRWLKEPGAIQPGTFMPNFHLSEGEINALTGFLHTLQGQKNQALKDWEENIAFSMDSRPREIGERIYIRFGCNGCHGKRGEGGYKNPNAAPAEKSPAINTITARLSKPDIIDVFMSGRQPAKLDSAGTMPLSCPAWKGDMTDEEAEYVYAFLVSLAPKK